LKPSPIPGSIEKGRAMFRLGILAAAAFLAVVALSILWPYDCATDTECEAAEAARCLILCER
jgi:hypothetical protein